MSSHNQQQQAAATLESTDYLLFLSLDTTTSSPQYVNYRKLFIADEAANQQVSAFQQQQNDGSGHINPPVTLSYDDIAQCMQDPKFPSIVSISW